MSINNVDDEIKDTNKNYTLNEVLIDEGTEIHSTIEEEGIERDSELDKMEIHSTITKAEVGEIKSKTERYEVLNVWKKDRAEEREKRTDIYDFLKRVIETVITALFIFVILDSMGIMVIEESVLKLLIVSIFGVVAGIFVIVVKYMFPEDGNKHFFEFMTNMYENDNLKQNDEVEE